MFEVFKIVKILEIAKEILWEKSRWKSCGSLERHALAKGLTEILLHVRNPLNWDFLKNY